MEDRGAINFELYRIFYVTAKCGNITAAAQQLYLTQPSVTKHIHTLEEELGCTLFYRSRRGVSLTPEGEALFRRVEPACRLFLSAEQELTQLRELQGGTVTIASTEMSFRSYVLPAMERFQEMHPKVHIRFSNALNAVMIDRLKNGLIDLAILHEPFRHEDFMDIRVLEQMDEYAVCGGKYAGFADSPRTPEELLSIPFISMPEGSSTFDYLTQYFAASGLSFQPDIELTTVELTIRAVERGLGIGILPQRLAAQGIAAGRLRQICLTRPMPSRNACLLMHRDRIPSTAVRAFAENVLMSNPG